MLNTDNIGKVIDIFDIPIDESNKRYWIEGERDYSVVPNSRKWGRIR